MLYLDGVPAGAVIAGKTRYLGEFDAATREQVRLALVKRTARSLALSASALAGGLAGGAVPARQG